MNIKLVSVYLALLLCLPVFAHADDFDPSLSQARSVFLNAVDGDKRAVRDATRRFKKLSHDFSREPVLMAYLGACMTLQGRDADNNLNKRRLTNDGLNQIDRALSLLSELNEYPARRRLDTQLVAASSYVHIPAFFNRHDKGARLLQQILSDTAFDTMADGFKAATYMAAALVAHGAGDDKAYRRYLDLTITVDPNGRNGRLAAGMREELTQ